MTRLRFGERGAERSHDSALRGSRAGARTMMLASVGVPLMPAGGSFCSLLKSRMRRLRAGVLMAPTSLALSSFLRRLKKAPVRLCVEGGVVAHTLQEPTTVSARARGALNALDYSSVARWRLDATGCDCRLPPPVRQRRPLREDPFFELKYQQGGCQKSSESFLRSFCRSDMKR